MRLRPYRRDDAKAIVTWCETEDIFYRWNAGLMGEYPLTEEHFAELIAGRVENEHQLAFTAFDEEGPMGFFLLRQPGESPDVLRFAFVIVSPRVRGTGAGREMMKLGLADAFEVYGAKRATLAVFEDNPAAYHCYLKAGFADSGRRETYRIKDTDLVCFEMEAEFKEVGFELC